MLIEEMHIDFGLKLQKVDAKVYENFQEEEIDWIINDTIRKYIESNMIPKKAKGINDSFQDTKPQYDNLEELIETKNIITYIHNDTKVYGHLPTDYFKLIDDATTVAVGNCNVSNDVVKTDAKLKYAVLDFKKDPFDNLYQYFQTGAFHNSGGSYDTFYLASTNFQGGLSSEDFRYLLVEDILRVINTGAFKDKIQVYWEKYEDIYVNSSFIFVSINGADYEDLVARFTPLPANDITITFQDLIKNIYTYSITTTGIYSNRLVKSEFINHYLNNSLLNTRFDSPISNIQNGKIFVTHNNKFLPENIELTYIRKPRKVSFERKVNCDLTPNVHEKIIDLVVERVSNAIQTNTLEQLKKIAPTVE